MATPRRVRTGLEELDWLRKQREQGMAAMRDMRNVQRIGPELAIKANAPAKTVQAMQQRVLDWEAKYYEPYKEMHAEIGRYVGSSKDPQGGVSKSVSPNIPRDKVTGARIKPGTGLNPMGSEYLYEGRTGVAPKAEAYRLTNAYSAGASATRTAASTGKYISEIRSRMSSTLKGGLSEYISNSAQYAGSSISDVRKAVVGRLTGEYGNNIGMLNRDIRSIGGDGTVFKRPEVNLPVNPSVRVTPPAPLKPTGSKFEPIKGGNTVPEAFKKAWGPGSFGGLAVGAGNLSQAMRHAGDMLSGNISDYESFQRSLGLSKGAFQTRMVIDFMRDPRNPPEHKYIMWKRFGPKRGY